MRARAILGTLLLMLLALRATLIYSQVSQGFNYQAVVRNSSGTPLVNQPVSLRITLQSSAENIYFSESKVISTTAQGVLNHIVGSGTLISGDLSTVPWSSGNIYFKVELDPNGGSNYTEMGTPTLLLPVPYALFAVSGNQGPSGADGTGISGVVDNGDGTLTFNFSDGSSYKTPNLKGEKGEKGDAGTGLNNRGNWQSGSSYNPGDYVFSANSGQTGNSMWIVQATAPFTSNIEPRQDLTNWIEFQAPQGEKGEKGESGTPILWLGTFSGTPTSYSLNNAYYNSTDKMSYVYNGTTWKTLAVDGSNGLSIVWKGDLSSAPPSPSANWAYYNTGTKKAYIYSGSSWDILAQDGMPISGTTGQTLYYNGTTWTPTSTLYNNNTNVGIGTSSPTQKLDINGGIRLRNLIYDASNSAGLANQLLVNNGSGATWQSLSTSGIASGTGTAGQVALWNGTNTIQGLSNVTWTSSLQVVSPTSAGADDPILEVKNKDGKVVLGVYQGGVRIYVDDSQITKGVRGGFAVGGLTNQSKGQQEYFRITPDSARIYVKEVPISKGVRGGFAVGGLTNQSKTVVSRNLMFVAPDSTRIYINDENTKGVRGGFAVGGLTNQSKGGNANFFNIETGATSIINPSEPRILWYPKKNAFLTGQVLIEHPDSVGTNSFASGFESKAKGEYSIVAGYQSKASGDWSQAFGYQTIAKGSNSTALGNQSVAIGESSFAIGFHSVSSGMQSAAFGGNCIASGANSMASGFYTTASGIVSFANGVYTTASGNNSLALGWQDNASGEASTAIGVGCSASNSYAFALGYASQASGQNSYSFGFLSQATNNHSYAFGKSCKADGVSSYAFGENVVAGSSVNSNCYAFGKQTQATGNGSYAFGDGAIASGDNSTAFGKLSQAIGSSSYALGEGVKAGTTSSGNCYALGKNSQATGDGSYAFGDGAQAIGTKSYAFGSFGQDGFTYPDGTNTIASGNNSFAAGQGAVASANNAISIGFCTKAWGNNAVALGFGSVAGDQHSGVAIGEYATASGYCAVAMGFWANASNVASVALGAATIATGYSSTSLGYYTYANADYSVAIGRGNLGLTNSLFEIGNGTSSWGGTGVRSNAFTILNNGMTGINCVPTAGLDVNGTEGTPLEASIQNTRANYPQIIFKATNGGTNSKIWRLVGRSTNDFEIQTLDDSYSNEITAMQINRNGTSIANVSFPNSALGIGTNSPSYSVENYGTNASYIAHYYSNTRGGFSALTNQRLAMLTTSSNDNLVFGYSSSTFQSFFSTNFIERMRIVNSTGNVGIGTSNPQSNLEVYTTGSNGYAGIAINSSLSGAKYITLNQGTAGKLTFTVPGVVDLVTMDFINYRMGINNSSPSYPFQVGNSTSNGNGAYVTTGGTWTNGSSRTFKDRFTMLNSADVLNKIIGIDVEGWYYKQTNEYHIGPVAEDFYNAFGTGDKNSNEVNKYLSPSDVAGVTLIAVKELIKENNDQKQKIEKQQIEIDELKAELESIKTLIKK